MLNNLFFAAFLLVSQTGTQESGIVAGVVKAPQPTNLSAPVQVVLLSREYTELWESEVQKRLDTSWERFKPAFAQKKEYFAEVSRMAYLESIQVIINRMRRDLVERVPAFIQFSTNEGRFEFKDVPLGEYRIVALGRADGRQLMWQDSVNLNDAFPHFLELKTPIP